MTFRLSARSLKNLEGVHPDLVAVVHEAIKITPVDFAVTEGLRSVERQKKLVAAGASMTMKSRHLTGHAVDLAAIVDGEANWKPHMYELIEIAMHSAANGLGVAIDWGGSWQTFKDFVHWELNRIMYP